MMKNRGVVLLSAFFLLFGFLYSGQGEAREDDPPVKHLKRHRPERFYNPIDDKGCISERLFREEDFLAALSEKEFRQYETEAEQGDADAMFLLSQIPHELDDGTREYPYQKKWLLAAAQAGHPVARFHMAEIAYRTQKRIAKAEWYLKKYNDPDSLYLWGLLQGEQPDPKGLDAGYAESMRNQAKKLLEDRAYAGTPPSDAEYLRMIEAAALAQGSGDLAFRLSFAYQNYNPEESDQMYKLGDSTYFTFLKADRVKGLHWLRIAAEKGNIEAARELCIWYSQGNDPRLAIDQPDGAQAARWCTVAAQARCPSDSAGYLAKLYEKGFGVPKSKIDAFYWGRMHQQPRHGYK